jgi:hypothetical protein
MTSPQLPTIILEHKHKNLSNLLIFFNKERNGDGDQAATPKATAAALKASINQPGRTPLQANITQSLNSRQRAQRSIYEPIQHQDVQTAAATKSPSTDEPQQPPISHREDGDSLSRAVNLMHLEESGEWGEHERLATHQTQSSTVDH